MRASILALVLAACSTAEPCGADLAVEAAEAWADGRFDNATAWCGHAYAGRWECLVLHPAGLRVLLMCTETECELREEGEP